MRILTKILISLVPVLGFGQSFFGSNYTVAAGGGSDYTYSRTITLDHTQVPNTDQSNFPVLLRGTYSYLATEANGGSVKSASGYDIGFYGDSGCSTTKLDWEVVRWVAATGEIAIWVKAPTVSHTSDTVIYLCYTSTTITTDQSNAIGVWSSSFAAVYHLESITSDPGNNVDNATSDSTSNANNLRNVFGYAVTATGLSGNCADLTNATNWARLSNSTPTGIPIGSNARTLTAWIKGWPASPGGYSNIVSSSTDAGSGAYFTIAQNADESVWFWGDSQNVGYAAGVAADRSVWNYAAVTYDGTTVRVTINGANEINGTPSLNSTASTIFIGEGGGPSVHYLGLIDEVRIASVARSNDWIVTEYNNQKSSSTFYTVGNQNTL